jgi:acetyltransferase
MCSVNSISLDQVFNPRSVAIVGASPDNVLSFSGWAIESLKKAGFPTIYPVNPRHTEAFGLPCYPSVSAIPGPVDHVVVSIPAGRVLELLDDCAHKGVQSVHFFTAGFSESGEKDRIELEKNMLLKARQGNFRIIGPNCVGLYIPGAKFTLASRMPMEPGCVAFMSQSGGHAQDMPLHAGMRGIRFSKVISYGNALDIDECELLDYFADDPETEIIAAYIEGVRDGRRFRSILERAAARKPVVIYKGGITQAGLKAARSHTASLTSSVRVFQSLCRQCNAILVYDVQELIDVLVALTFARPFPKGYGIGVMGVGGGPTVQASDQMEAAGLRLVSIPPGIGAEMRQWLPAAGAIFTNPLDATNLIYPDIIQKTMLALGKISDLHMFMYHMGFHPVSRWGEGRFANDFFIKPVIEAFDTARKTTGKPVILALGLASDMAGTQERLQIQEAMVKAGLPVFGNIDKAAVAMARLGNWNIRR